MQERQNIYLVWRRLPVLPLASTWEHGCDEYPLEAGTFLVPCQPTASHVLASSGAIALSSEQIQQLSSFYRDWMFGVLLLPFSRKTSHISAVLSLAVFTLGRGQACNMTSLLAVCDTSLLCRYAVVSVPTSLIFRKEMLCLWPVLGHGCPCLFCRMKTYNKSKWVS